MRLKMDDTALEKYFEPQLDKYQKRQNAWDNAIKHLKELPARRSKEPLDRKPIDDDFMYCKRDDSKMPYDLIKMAFSNAPILLTGETGTGKEEFSKIIHNESKLKGQFVALNCAGLSGELFISELFGHKKGAFTGAVSDHKGLVSQAEKGTLLLDEIGEVPIHIQAKLLRFLNDGRYRWLGSEKEKKSNARIIAATNRDIERDVSEGVFREDLYYRLEVFKINLPPLKKRKTEIPDLVSHFIRKYEKEIYNRVQGISKNALQLLINYNWPGNIRQLESTIRRIMPFCEGNEIEVDDVNNYGRLNENIKIHKYDNFILNLKDAIEPLLKDFNTWPTDEKNFINDVIRPVVADCCKDINLTQKQKDKAGVTASTKGKDKSVFEKSVNKYPELLKKYSE